MREFLNISKFAPLLLLSCATTQVDDWGTSSQTVPKPPEAAALRNEPNQHGPAKQGIFLWEASKGDAVVYFFGSVHIGDLGMRIPDVVLRALRRSRTVAFEIDPRDESQGERLLEKGTSQDESLEDVISPSDYAKVSKVAAQMGMPMTIVDRLKPWMAGLLFQSVAMMKLGYTPENGIENQILQYAEGRPIVALESIDLQVGVFSSMPLELQREMLAEALLDLGEVEKKTDELMSRWKSGDEAGMEKLVFKDLEDHPELTAPYYESMIFNRNVGMANKVESMMRSGGRHLVVVGTAHLIGSKGVPALLAKSGATVKRLHKGSLLEPELAH
ncbi:MAG: TraB/GumN family protein [Deltaproteobacteria bacterium]|nr:TraB/GumN family protein [Deltaproteobacteria bacterium]